MGVCHGRVGVCPPGAIPAVRVLVTCPPMLGVIDEFIPEAAALGLRLTPAKVRQTLSEAELIAKLPEYDGWIIGDDPATRAVLEAGKAGRLKAAVKWGIGVDNIDFTAFRDLDIPIANTPMMFGDEVADVALAYTIGLARQLFFVDREVRSSNAWPKPTGVSLSGKHVGLIGLGDIGRRLAKRLLALDMVVTGFDPGVVEDGGPPGIRRAAWPAGLDTIDFLIFVCALNAGSRRMLNATTLGLCKPGVYVVNVSRGQLIDEAALVSALASGHVRAAALDVFEEEPLPAISKLRSFPQCIFGAHNGSNTEEAVRRASLAAIGKIKTFLLGPKP